MESTEVGQPLGLACNAGLGPLVDSEEDPARLWAEIHRLRAAVAGPDGYASWQDAATAERVRRMKLHSAGEVLVHAYRERYKKHSTDGLRAGSPLFREMADFNGVLRA